MKLGCHVSNRLPLLLEGSALEAIGFHANCFMVYLGAPQNSFRKPIEEMNYQSMQNVLTKNKIGCQDVIIHAPYIVNMCHPNIENRLFAIDFIVKEVMMANTMGSNIYVFHPGSALHQEKEVALSYLIDSIKMIIEKTKQTEVILALETMSGKGSEVCSHFSEIAYVCNQVNHERLKVCFDTCHVFDSGYDLKNNYSEVMNAFSIQIGLNMIAVFHINDSKNICGAKKDRHENIGFGNIGFAFFDQLIYDERFLQVPKILETPYVKTKQASYPPYKAEIKMLKKREFNKNLINDLKNQKEIL